MNDELENIKRLLAAVEKEAPEKWEVGKGFMNPYIETEDHQALICDMQDIGAGEPDIADLIVALRNNAPALIARLEAAEARVAELERAVSLQCHWKQAIYSDFGEWDGDCGISWIFEDGGPEENDMNFCPSCGRILVIVPLPTPPESEARELQLDETRAPWRSPYPAMPPGDWVSVGDRLPEKAGLYDILSWHPYNDDGLHRVMFFQGHDQFTPDKGWFNDGLPYTHWKPYHEPEPPAQV